MKRVLFGLVFLVNAAGAQISEGNSFKGMFLGSFPSGDTFALIVSSNKDAAFYLVGTQTRQVGYATNIQLNSDGAFTIPNTPLNGRVSGNSVVLSVQGQQVSTSLVSPAGPYAAQSGYFAGIARDRVGAEAFFAILIAPDGRTLCYFVTPTAEDGAVGRMESTTRAGLTMAAGQPATMVVDSRSEVSSLFGSFSWPAGVLTFSAIRKSVAYRLANLASRGFVGTGGSVLIAGFVVSTGAKTLLIRAAGPALASFGVGGALNDPQLSIFDSSGRQVASNDNWSSLSTFLLPTNIVNATTRAGAFSFSPGSRDSALVLNLEPGNYTAQVSGAADTTGVALVEVYEVD